MGGVENACRSLSQKGHDIKPRRERRPTLGGRACGKQPFGLPTSSSDLTQPCCDFYLARPRRGKGCRPAGEAAPAPLFGARWPAHFKRRRAQPQHQLYTAGQHLNSGAPSCEGAGSRIKAWIRTRACPAGRGAPGKQSFPARSPFAGLVPGLVETPLALFVKAPGPHADERSGVARSLVTAWTAGDDRECGLQRRDVDGVWAR